MHSSHFLGKEMAQALNIFSSTWFTLSVWPSICGWYVELLRSWVPRHSKSCSQKRETKTNPLSEMIVRGTPCKVTIWSKYISAYFLVVYLVSTRIKWADLVRRSTMAQIESKPMEVRDKPTMKSIEISSYFQTGIGKGCKNPNVLGDILLHIWPTI